MEKNTLVLNASSGISGDMTVAALLDLGANRENLMKALNSLHLEGASVVISRVKKSALDACDFDVILDHEHENHDHDMAYLHPERALGSEKHSHIEETDHHHDGHDHAHVDHHHHDEHDHAHD